MTRTAPQSWEKRERNVHVLQATRTCATRKNFVFVKTHKTGGTAVQKIVNRFAEKLRLSTVQSFAVFWHNFGGDQFITFTCYDIFVLVMTYSYLLWRHTQGASAVRPFMGGYPGRINPRFIFVHANGTWRRLSDGVTVVPHEHLRFDAQVMKRTMPGGTL